MGEAYLDRDNGILWISSVLVLYGDAADSALAALVAAEVEAAWNAPAATQPIGGRAFGVRFRVSGDCRRGLDAGDVHRNLDPRVNFFRVETFSRHHVSCVDEIGSNTGYFLADNLLNGSTTAAHEYGHTLGLPHPAVLDIRGRGQPGIMYPRGTLVDAPFQWDPEAPAGARGGTLNPAYRKVLASDIAGLGLGRLHWSRDGRAVVGEFTNLYHDKH